MTSTEEYELFAMSTNMYPDSNHLELLTLGLNGEAGEVAEKVKKKHRDDTFDHEQLAKELGDVLWYVANIANHLGYNLEEIMQMNHDKLKARLASNKIKGSGDNRELE